MARPEGFEPPTAWFVARYSIQLSYGRFVIEDMYYSALFLPVNSLSNNSAKRTFSFSIKRYKASL